MKACGDYEEWISAYLDGGLTKPEQAELMEHMAACRSCQQYFDDLAAIHAAMMEEEEVPVPEGFAEQVMARVRETEQEKAEGRKVIPVPWRRWAALAACCAFVALGAWWSQSRKTADLSTAEGVAVTDTAPRMTRAADMPAAAAGDGVMAMMDEEVALEDGLSRMADSTSGGEIVEFEVEDDAEERKATVEYAAQETAKENAPLPSPMAPARDNMEGGTLVAGGDAVRQWVEDVLGLDWESGQVYALTAEQYDALVEILTEAGVDFRVEAGDAFRLAAE